MSHQRNNGRKHAQVRSSSAFTLLEILTVIGIVSIIVGLAMPSISSAKRAGKRVVCAANQHSIWIASGLYSVDFDDKLPRGKDCVDLLRPEYFPPEIGIDRIPLLTEVVLTYLKSKEVFECPSDSGTTVSESMFPEVLELAPTAFDHCGNSYEYRTELAVSTNSTFHTVLDPSKVNLLADLAGHWHGDGGKPSHLDTLDEYQSRLFEFRYVITFIDGHSSLKTNKQLEDSWRSH